MECESRIRYELAGDESFSEGVVTAMANAHGMDAEELPRLYDTVDPDALDAILESLEPGTTDGGGTVAFSYMDHAVTVYSCGSIRICPSEVEH